MDEREIESLRKRLERLIELVGQSAVRMLAGVAGCSRQTLGKFRKGESIELRYMLNLDKFMAGKSIDNIPGRAEFLSIPSAYMMRDLMDRITLLKEKGIDMVAEFFDFNNELLYLRRKVDELNDRYAEMYERTKKLEGRTRGSRK